MKFLLLSLLYIQLFTLGICFRTKNKFKMKLLHRSRNDNLPTSPVHESGGVKLFKRTAKDLIDNSQVYEANKKYSESPLGVDDTDDNGESYQFYFREIQKQDPEIISARAVFSVQTLRINQYAIYYGDSDVKFM